MKFQPNNKAGGRKKGSVNIATKNIRNAVELIVDNNLEKLQEDIDNLSPKDRINALTNLIGYVLPKLKQIDAKIDNTKEPIIINLGSGIAPEDYED